LSVNDSESSQSPSGTATVPWLIAIAASAGGIHALRTILSKLPSELPASIVIVQHRPPDHHSNLHELLSRRTSWPVRVASQGEPIKSGYVYLARPDSHLTVTPDRTFMYRDGTRIRFLRSSANPLFESAAKVLDGHVLGVVLTGGGRDATDGVQGVKEHGGMVIAQDRSTSESWGMPQSAIASGAVDYVLPLDAIAPAIAHIVRGEAVPAVPATS
jgi:two-component system chemotaxis response regulator CheB